MKRPLAYITAAWCGDPDTDMVFGSGKNSHYGPGKISQM